MQNDPANPWVKDPSGKHTNVSALLDWPEESDESDSEVTSPSKFSAVSAVAAAAAGNDGPAVDPANVNLDMAAASCANSTLGACRYSR